MAYKRVTREERNLIYRWRQEGLGPREAARRLGRAASSICRELARNQGQRGYRAKQAHALEGDGVGQTTGAAAVHEGGAGRLDRWWIR